MKKSDKIYIAGHKGLVGSALFNNLKTKGYENIITRAHDELDLTQMPAVAEFFQLEKPDYVFLAAAKVGGIHANNTYPGEFIYHNLAIQTNVLHQAYLSKVKRLLFLGSSCIYPKNASQPIDETSLLTGSLEETNRPYAIAKIAGIEMCWSYNRQYGTNFLAAMPTNLYGVNDNYDLNTSHVLPALLRKIHLAKLASEGNIGAIENDEKIYGVLNKTYKDELIRAARAKRTPSITVWGTGKPRREFMYNEDMAEACVYLMQLPNEKFQSLLAGNRNDGKPPVVNIGVSEDISIFDLAFLLRKIIGYQGDIIFDKEKPDGTAQKMMSSKQLNDLGWSTNSDLSSRLIELYQSYASK
jgi:GDP-L-fucose synthase